MLYVFRKELLDKLQFENKTEVIGGIIQFSFATRTDSRNLYQIQVSYSPIIQIALLSDVGDKVVELVECYSRWESFPRVIYLGSPIKESLNIVFLDIADEDVLGQVQIVQINLLTWILDDFIGVLSL